jgi:hypothetical protein
MHYNTSPSQSYTLPSRSKASAGPKLVKEYAYPITRETEKRKQIENKMTEKNKHQAVTRGIVNMGFSSFRGAVTRYKINCNLTGKKPAIPY